MSECANGCDEDYADDPNHHHHDFSHSHQSNDVGHTHTNLFDDDMVLYKRAGCEGGCEGEGFVQVYPEVSGG